MRLESAASGIFNSADTQCTSTHNIADRMADVSVSTRSVAKNIDEAQGTASATEDMSTVVLQASDLLEERALQLQDQVSQFVLQIQQGSASAATHGEPAHLPLAGAMYGFPAAW